MLQNDWEITKIDDFLMIQSMIFWWFGEIFLGMIFWKNWGKSSKNNRLNHQKIIDFGIFPWFSLTMLQNDWEIPKSIIFWWFNRWFFDDLGKSFWRWFFEKTEGNHQKIIDWIIKKSSILGFSNQFATCSMKTQGKSQNRWFFDDSIDGFLMISLSFFKKSSPERFPQIIKKSSIESSKNHRFWDFPIILQHMFNENQGKSQNRWFFDDSIDDFLMISLSFFKKSSPERFPQIIKKSSIESSKNHRFWDFPIILQHKFNENQGKSQNRWFFDDSIDDILMISLSFFKNHPQTGFPKSSKNHRLNHQKIIGFSTIPRNATQNHQKIIVWIINFLHISTGLPLFQSFWNIFNENQGNIPKMMISW